MPRIRTYQSKESGGINPTSRMQARVSPEFASMRYLGQQVANAGVSIGDAIERQQTFEANKTLLELQNETLVGLEEAKKNAGPGAQGFSKQVEERFQQRRTQILDNAASNSQRERLEMGMDKMGINVLEQASSYEIQESGRYAKQQFSENLNGIRKSVIANPNYVDVAWETVQQTIAADPYFNETQKLTISSQAKNDVYDDALNGSIVNLESASGVSSKQVQSYLESIKQDGSKFKTNTSVAGYEQAIKRLENFQERLKSIEVQNDVGNLQQEMAYMESTGNDRGLYSADKIKSYGLPEKQTKKLLESLETSKLVAQEVQGVKNKSFPELFDSINEGEVKKTLESDPDNFFRNQKILAARQKAVTMQYKKFQADPTGYILDSDSSAQNLFKSLNSDPTPQKAKLYADYVLSQQQEKMPGFSGSLLTRDQINTAKSVLAGAGEGKAEMAASYLQSQAQLWGDNFKYVVKDLKANKALNNEQYVAASMWDDPGSKSLAEDMLRAGSVADKDINPFLDESMTETLKNVDGQLQDFKNSMKGMSAQSMEQNYGSIAKAIAKTYRYKKSRGEDVSVSDIADQVINERYEFDGDIRIPKTAQIIKPDGTVSLEPVDTDEISDKKSEVFSFIKNKELVMPPDNFGLSSKDAAQRYKSAILSSGQFRNDGDRGIRLVDEDGNQVEYIVDGKKVRASWTWQQIKNGVNEPEPIRIKATINKGLADDLGR